MSSLLSQDEIDALLNDTFPSGSEEENNQTNDLLSEVEKDTLGELANISMGTSATTLSSLLGKKVEITTPTIMVTTIGDLIERYPKPYVIVDVNYNAGIIGSNVFIIHTYDAGVIVDLMMGGDGSNPPMELNDLHLSAISEAMNQMMGSSCTSLSQMLNKKIDISPPSLDLIELNEHEGILGGRNKDIVQISFRVQIQGLIDSEMMQLLPVEFAKEMVTELNKLNKVDTEQPKTKPPEKPANKKSEKQPNPPQQEPYPKMEVPTDSHNESQVAVSAVQFNAFKEENLPVQSMPNLNLIMDVGLQLTVELGKTSKKIKDILELSVGSIIELDKLAGEPVDVLVNGKLLAKGEVVVIDENFGVRITEIISPEERVKNLR